MNSTHTKHLMAFAEYEHVREEFKLGDCVNICNRRSILGVWGEKIADLQIIPIPYERAKYYTTGYAFAHDC